MFQSVLFVMCLWLCRFLFQACIVVACFLFYRAILEVAGQSSAKFARDLNCLSWRHTQHPPVESPRLAQLPANRIARVRRVHSVYGLQEDLIASVCRVHCLHADYGMLADLSVAAPCAACTVECSHQRVVSTTACAGSQCCQ